jgi:CDP-glycerol glycerophosphotransferase
VSRSRDWRSRAISVARRSLPAKRQAFVYGLPSTEGNAVELVRGLLQAYSGSVAWPDAPSERFLRAAGIPATSRLVRLPPLRSVQTLREYVRSEIVFATHGLYAMPPPSANRPVIDLWHGDATKDGGPLYPTRGLRSEPSSLMISASRRLAPLKLRMAGMRPDEGVWVANPRVAQMEHPATDADLAGLGVDPSRPFVVWMPTWRRGTASIERAVNTRDASADHELADRFGALVRQSFADAGITLVVKPHPSDRESRRTPGAVVVSQARLDAQAVPLYRLLGASSGLITDYSSAWIDYLAIDKPIGFYMPDRDAYDRGTSAPLTDAYDVLPGLELATPDDVEEFAKDVCGSDSTVSSRQQARDHLGLWSGTDPTGYLLNELASRGMIDLT